VNFKLQNTGAQTQLFDVGVFAETDFDGDTTAPVGSFDNGFVVYSSANAMTISVQDLTFADNVTTFWFGRRDAVSSNVYQQVSGTEFYGEPSGYAFSWQRISAPAGGNVSRTAVVKLGSPTLNRLIFVIATYNIPDTMYFLNSETTVGILSSDREDVVCSLFVFVDSDTSVVYRSDEVSPNAQFSYSFSPANFDVAPGLHTFTICAADDIGTVSNGQSFTCLVTAPSKTPIATVAPTISASPAQTTPPAPTYPAAPIIPISVSCAADYNFDLTGIAGDDVIPVTYWRRGFATRLRVWGVETESAQHCQSRSEFSVTLLTNVTSISPNAVLLNFQIVNYNWVSTTASIEVNAELAFDNDDSAPIRNAGSNIIVYSARHALTFVVRNAPLVDNVSAFWFGSADTMGGNFWSQVNVGYIHSPYTAVAFSWQDISIPIFGRAWRSVVVKFGLPDASQLSLSVVTAPTSARIGRSIDVVVAVASIEEGEQVRVYLVVDDDTSTIWLVALDGPANGEVHCTINVTMSTGNRKMSLFAVDSIGTVSAAASFTLLVQAPARTVLNSRTLLMSPLGSRSPISPQGTPGTENRTATELQEEHTGPDAQDGGTTGKLEAGEIVGIIIAQLIVISAAIAIIVWKVKKRRPDKLDMDLTDTEIFETMHRIPTLNSDL
jgi:hypothetical protein